jgi:hypothetical protein
MIRVPLGILKCGKVLKETPGGPLTGLIRKRIESQIEPLGDEGNYHKTERGIDWSINAIGNKHDFLCIILFHSYHYVLHHIYKNIMI